MLPDGQRLPQDSAYYHPQLNPLGLPPPGKPQKYIGGAQPVSALPEPAHGQSGPGKQLEGSEDKEALPEPDAPVPPPAYPPEQLAQASVAFLFVPSFSPSSFL